jgi:hypothetical protein
MHVCPFCGEPPGAAVFCEACGRNLAGVDRLPTPEEFRASSTPEERLGPADAAAAIETFLAAMHAAGDPGADRIQAGKPGVFRTRRVSGWIVRPVDREDFEEPKRYEPGLVLTVEGRFHQLDSVLRGWGQRDFPQYLQVVSTEPIEPPLEPRLVRELATLRAVNGA